MSEHSVKVSIVIPVYNVKMYLCECLDSLINQSLQEIEIICIDDCSTDGSLDILKEYESKDYRIKIIKNKKNRGQAYTRNIGLQHANGEYIGFVDSDDFVDENYYKVLYENAKKYDCDISCTTNVIIYPDMKKKQSPIQIVENICNDYNIINLTSREERKKMISWDVIWNKIYKQTFLKKYNINFPEVPYEDGAFTFMTISSSSSIIVSDNIKYFYRTREGSIMNTKWSDKHFSRINVFHFIEEFILKNKDSEYWFSLYKEWMTARISYMFYRFEDNQTRKKFCSYVKEQKINVDLPHILPEAIISLTSYPDRIHAVEHVALSLLQQDIPSKKVILWLAESQFPRKEKDLPDGLLALCNKGLSIEWCEDWRPYKKLIPALMMYPDDIIVTADDDVIYPSNWLRRLVEAYVAQPDKLHCLRAHEVTFKSGEIANYNSWKHEIDFVSPSFCNFFTGVGGVLYKKDLLHEDILKKDLFLNLCPDADDIWFWGMAVLKGTKINAVSPSLNSLKPVDGTREKALWKVAPD